MEQQDRQSTQKPESDNPIKELWTGIKKLFLVITSVLVSVVVIVVVVSIFSSGKDKTTNTQVQQKVHDDIEAYVSAESIVSKFLKSPSTAKYPMYPQADVYNINDNEFVVSAYVDSQNGFGAMIRSNWTVHLKFVDDSLNALPIEVVIDDQVVYKDTPSE